MEIRNRKFEIRNVLVLASNDLLGSRPHKPIMTQPVVKLDVCINESRSDGR